MITLTLKERQLLGWFIFPIFGTFAAIGFDGYVLSSLHLTISASVEWTKPAKALLDQAWSKKNAEALLAVNPLVKWKPNALMAQHLYCPSVLTGIGLSVTLLAVAILAYCCRQHPATAAEQGQAQDGQHGSLLPHRDPRQRRNTPQTVCNFPKICAIGLGVAAAYTLAAWYAYSASHTYYDNTQNADHFPSDFKQCLLN